MVEDEQVVYTDPDGKVWHPHRGYWCWKVSSELAQAQERIKELEAQLAETKAENERLIKINADHCRAVNTYIVSNARLEERALDAEARLSALEATPPAPKVTEAAFEQMARALVPFAYGAFEQRGTETVPFEPGKPNANCYNAVRALTAAQDK